MLELKSLDPKTKLLPRPQAGPSAPKQQRLMVVALSLLLVTLVVVLYRDRDFWFPDASDAEDQIPPADHIANTAAAPAKSAQSPTPTKKSRARARKHSVRVAVAATPVADPPTDAVTVKRTVLPPLEIEVVAGASHRLVQPGSNSVRLDTKDDSPDSAHEVATGTEDDSAASVTRYAADTAATAPTADEVARSVEPDYPLLARQMKVQGSVILQALISRDGMIQDLRVLTGPPILAVAAQEAVRQWHFKPHYDGGAAVETQAKITVNFTISTN